MPLEDVVSDFTKKLSKMLEVSDAPESSFS